MAKKRLQDMTDRKVMSFKEAAKALNWTLTEDDEVYTVSCDCGNSKIEYTGVIGVQKVRCSNCGKQMSSLISLNPACRLMIDIEKDEEGNERFWIIENNGDINHEDKGEINHEEDQTETITDWLSKQEDYGLCNPPMDAQKALHFLAEYLDIPEDTMPENEQQTNTYIVCKILDRYSKKYRKELKNK